ncbi:MAG TPA: hypothetical protein VGB67_11575, partial [Fibrella sp.]
MLNSDHRREEYEPIGAEYHHVTDVFLIHQDMYHQDEPGEEEVVRQLNSEERLHVYADLEIVIVHDKLVDDSGQHQEGHPYSDDESKSHKFSQE